MDDFDPAKDAINQSKHGLSLARWVDLEVLAIVNDDRFHYGEPRYRAYGLIDGAAHCLFLQFATNNIGRSASDVPTQRK